MNGFRSNLPGNLQNLRSQMPVIANCAYFDHAAVGPLTLAASEAITTWLGQATETGDLKWLAWSKGVDATRQAAADLINAKPTEIALIPSTTYGINVVADGFSWQPGDSVIVPANEFPSNYLPWSRLADRGVEVRVYQPQPNGELVIEDMIALVDHSTRMISVSWVGYLSGFRIDLARLVHEAHQRDVLVFVDAIQGLGAFPMDVAAWDVDFLAADGHKWMLGPEGAGFMYIAERHLERIRPQMVGWNSVRAAGDFNNQNARLKESSSRFEGGTTNMVGMLGLGGSLVTLLQAGAHRAESGFSEQILTSASYAQQRLECIGCEVYRQYDSANQSGIISFKVPGNESVAIRELCIREGIILSVRSGRVRIAIHAYNTEQEINRLIHLLSDSRK